jgi:hypothetical protein
VIRGSGTKQLAKGNKEGTMRNQSCKPLLLTFVSVISFAVTAQAGLDNGLLANWTFDNCTAADSVGNHLDGLISGNPLCTPGVTSNALSVDGSGD